MNDENLTLDNLLNQTNIEESNQTITEPTNQANAEEVNQTITEPAKQANAEENNQTVIEQIDHTITEESSQILNMLSNQTTFDQSNQTVATEPNYKLTNEQKTYILGNLTELENYGIEYYHYTMSSKLNIAKAFYEEGEININNIYKMLPTHVNETEAVISTIQELAPNLTESRIVAFGKFSCTILSIGDHTLSFNDKLFPSNNHTLLSLIEKNLVPVCNEVTTTNNIYDHNFYNMTVDKLIHYIDNPLDIFVLSTIGNTTTLEAADVAI